MARYLRAVYIPAEESVKPRTTRIYVQSVEEDEAKEATGCSGFFMLTLTRSCRASDDNNDNFCRVEGQHQQKKGTASTKAEDSCHGFGHRQAVH